MQGKLSESGVVFTAPTVPVASIRIHLPELCKPSTRYSATLFAVADETDRVEVIAWSDADGNLLVEFPKSFVMWVGCDYCITVVEEPQQGIEASFSFDDSMDAPPHTRS